MINGSGNGVALDRQQAIINVHKVSWHCMASLGNNELKHSCCLHIWVMKYVANETFPQNQISEVLTHHSLVSPYGDIDPGPTFIKQDQLDPRIKDQMKITLLSTILPLQLPNFVSCGRDKPSHRTQNLVTVGTKLWTAERFLVDPWSLD